MSNSTKSTEETLSPFLDAADIRAQSLPEVRKGGLDPVAVATLIERAAVTLDAYEIAFNSLHQERADLIAQGDRAQSESEEPTSAVAARTLAAAAHTVDEMLAAAEAEAAQIREAFAAEHQQLADTLERTKQENSNAIAALSAQLRAETAASLAELTEMRNKLDQWRQDFAARALDATDALTGVFANVQNDLARPLAPGTQDSADTTGDTAGDTEPAPVDPESRGSATGLFSS